MTYSSTETIIVTAIASVASAIAGIVFTYFLTRRREHEADWRKLKFSQYQEFILALSGIVDGRDTSEAHKRYADAVNSLALVASQKVLFAMRDFLSENSYRNKQKWTLERHDLLLNILVHAIRKDISPNRFPTNSTFQFHLLAPPPEHD